MDYDDFSELDHYLHAVDWMIKNRFKKHKNPLKRLIKLRGNRCSLCGSRKNLEFHHNENNKEKNVCEFETFGEMRSEAGKCILVCKDCHDNRIHNTFSQ